MPSTSSGFAWALSLLFLLTTTVAVKAGDYTYTTNSDNTLTITGYTGTNGLVVIPSTIEGRTVAHIGYGAFGAFGCDENTWLTSIIIPDSVISIGGDAFYHCSMLTNAIIPDSVTSIGDEAFGDCHNLTSVRIPIRLTSIGSYVFDFNVSLTSITIPDSVTNVGFRAFGYCRGLVSVMIGRGVTSIAQKAFGGCSRLVGVYFMGNAPNIGSDVFDSDNNATVYCLPGTTGWGWTFGGRPAMQWWDGPQISANGMRGDISINRADTLKISVAMNADGHAGVPLDWWAIARANSSFYYLNSLGQWIQFDGNFSNCHPVLQTGLFNLPSVEVLNARGLQPGSYTFWFAIDYPMDGILNLGGYILLDSVNVTVE